MAELTGRDLGHTIKIGEDGPEGVLGRILHEGGPEGIQPTYIRLYTTGLTESSIGRYHPETPVVVEPLMVDVIDATSDV